MFQEHKNLRTQGLKKKEDFYERTRKDYRLQTPAKMDSSLRGNDEAKVLKANG
jgi:hypothetical protein